MSIFTQCPQTKPPLIIDALKSSLFGTCVPSLELIDEDSGKELRLLDLIIQSARKSRIEEVYVCVVDDCRESDAICEHISHLEKKKKKKLNKTRIEILRFHTVMSQAELMRKIEVVLGPVLNSGFCWISSCSLPPQDWNVLFEAHKTALKKDAATVATLFPCQISALSCISLPEERSLVIADGKTHELIAYLRFNNYEESALDFKSRIPLEGRWGRLPETMVIRSDLRLESVFCGSPGLLTLVKANFDYSNMEDVLENALKGDIKMESIYLSLSHLQAFSQSQSISGTFPVGASVHHGRLLYELLRHDSQKESDTILDFGTRSTWKFSPTLKLVYHETFHIEEQESSVLESLIMKGARIGKKTDIISCIVSEAVEISEGCTLHSMVVMPGVRIPANSRFVNGVISSSTDKLDSERYCIKEQHIWGTFWTPSDETQFLRNEVPNSHWQSFAKPFENDPSWDSDKLFDELYGNDEDEETGNARRCEEQLDDDEDEISEAEFHRDIQSMLKSVIDKPQFVENLVLELRSYRLSANKSDISVLQGIVPVIIEWIIDNNLLENKKDNALGKSQLGSLLEIFAAANQTAGQQIIFDECWHTCKAEPDMFVRLLHMLQPYTTQEQVLTTWVKSLQEASRRQLEGSKLFTSYMHWLMEPSEEDDDE